MKHSYFIMDSNNKILSADGTFSSHHPKDEKALEHADEKCAQDKIKAIGKPKLSVIRIAKKDNLKE